jgi:hypothetical protein
MRKNSNTINACNTALTAIALLRSVSNKAEINLPLKVASELLVGSHFDGEKFAEAWDAVKEKAEKEWSANDDDSVFSMAFVAADEAAMGVLHFDTIG